MGAMIWISKIEFISGSDEVAHVWIKDGMVDWPSWGEYEVVLERIALFVPFSYTIVIHISALGDLKLDTTVERKRHDNLVENGVIAAGNTRKRFVRWVVGE